MDTHYQAHSAFSDQRISTTPLPPVAIGDLPRRPHEERWEEFREVIKEKYAERKSGRGLTLKRLVDYMAKEHGFYATEDQYKRKFRLWGRRRNLDLKSACHILRLLDDAEKKGINRTVYLDGYPKSIADIEYYLSRQKVRRSTKEVMDFLRKTEPRPKYIKHTDVTTEPSHAPARETHAVGSQAPFIPNAEIPTSFEYGPTSSMTDDFSTPMFIATPSHEPDCEPFHFANLGNQQGQHAAHAQSSLPVASPSGQENDLFDMCVDYPPDVDYPPEGDSAALMARALATIGTPGIDAMAQQLYDPLPGRIDEAINPLWYSLLSGTPLDMEEDAVQRYMTKGGACSRDINTAAQETKTLQDRIPDRRGVCVLFIRACLMTCVYQSQGYLEYTTARMESAMDHFKIMIMYNNHEILSTISILLALLESYGQAPMAVKILEKVLEITDKHHGNGGVVAQMICYWKLALMRTEQDQLSRTDKSQDDYNSIWFKNTLKKVSTSFGPESPSALAVSYAVGRALSQEGKIDEAVNHLKNLQAQCETLLSLNHIQTVSCMTTLARVFYQKKDFENAASLMAEATERLDKVFDRFHPYRLEVRSRQAKFLDAIEDYGEAERVLCEAFAEQFAVLGPHNPRTQTTQRRLRNLLEKQERGAEVLSLVKMLASGHDSTYCELLRVGRL